MKKILLLVAVAGLVAASCRKDLTCECKTTSDQAGFVSTTSVHTMKDTKKKNADCNSFTVKLTAPVAGTVTTGEDCELK